MGKKCFSMVMSKMTPEGTMYCTSNVSPVGRADVRWSEILKKFPCMSTQWQMYHQIGPLESLKPFMSTLVPAVVWWMCPY